MNFKIAFRQIKKQKIYAAINIGGLAIGIACCMLIALYIKHELSYDRHHSKADRIYRVTRDMNMQGLQNINAVTPAPLAKTLKKDYPEVVKAARINPYFAGTNLVLPEGAQQKSFEKSFVFADQEFFEIFDLPLLHGDVNNLLNQPDQVVITKKIADKYFPNQNPVGKTLTLNDNTDFVYKITGVMEEIPSTSHFNYDFWLSMERLDDSRDNQWLFNNYYTYVVVTPETDPDALTEKMREMEDRYLALQFKEVSNMDLNEMRASGQYYHFFLKPLTDIHLYSDPNSPQLQGNGDIRAVRIFGAIAVLILVIALFNYMNLSTAQSATRAKEVGVRKVLGSMRTHLVRQFLSESLLTTLAAFVIALFLIEAFAKYFSYISDIQLTVPWLSWWFLPALLLGIVVIGVLAGLYPAFYMSAFRPIETLKGELNKGRKSQWL
ncbi:MAG: ABC transporter permease, partial [Bacteroidota bacterium]